jgi:hypothetical protein
MLMSLSYFISTPNLWDNHIAQVSSLEVAESVLHLINCCLLFGSFRSFPLIIILKKKKKKEKKKKPNYSNTTYNIKDYICGCNRLIERLSKWSWIFHLFLSLLQTRCVFLLILVLFVIVFILYYYVFIHVCKYHYKISQFYRRKNSIGVWLEVRRWFFYRCHHWRITSVGFPFVGDSPFRRYIGRKNKKTICRWFYRRNLRAKKKKIPAWNIPTDF